jgi:hypothetical protein
MALSFSHLAPLYLVCYIPATLTSFRALDHSEFTQTAHVPLHYLSLGCNSTISAPQSRLLPVASYSFILFYFPHCNVTIIDTLVQLFKCMSSNNQNRSFFRTEIHSISSLLQAQTLVLCGLSKCLLH